MIRVRLLWTTGQRTYTDIDIDRPRTIRHGSAVFRDTGETDADGIDTYADAGCGWTRVHVNHVLSSVLLTPPGMFAARATRDGHVIPVGTYHLLPAAKAAADLEARCPRCRCPPWVSDQGRTVDR